MLWFVIGLIIGSGLIYLVLSNKYKVLWYQWALGIVTIALFLTTLQNILGFVRELEPMAITFTLLVMGIPTVILGVLAVMLPKFISKTKAQTSKEISKSV
ncbi:MAG: hypothetical protein WCR27_07875 [Eubacteriales bacterium]